MAWRFSLGRCGRWLLVSVGWVAGGLASGLAAGEVRIDVDASQVVQTLPRTQLGVCIEDVNHEIYGGLYSQMVFGESFQEPAGPQPPTPEAGWAANLSGRWQGVTTGTAFGRTKLETEQPFVGRQSQRLTFVHGAGTVGVANAGLFGGPAAGASAEPEAGLAHGMCFVPNQPYEGCVWARTENPCVLLVSLEGGDGGTLLAEARLHLPAGAEWQRLAFALTPKATEGRGRLVIKLDRPGSVVLGYAGLQPGAWGRYKGLPVRRDVVEGLLDQGVTALRYGGSMVNVPGYRWKHMIGPRERRAPYRGNWYPFSTNGWAVPDFLNLCEAAGFVGIPDLSVDETPQDLADFIEYVNGPADSPWGRQRAADGHPAPYGLRHLELGNEEKVDDAYFRKFQALAECIWALDGQIVLVVGDFAYTRPIDDPFHLRGADSGLTTLAAQQKILALAREHGREVWFDVHVNTETPDPASDSVRAFPSYVAAIDRLAEGAKHRVVCFELNANTHDQNRALANAQAIQMMQRLAERVPTVCSANGLQPDGHNDNGWNQGLLFLNPARTWLQPPGYVTRMLARHAQALLVRSAVPPDGGGLDVCATRSADGRTLAVQVLNLSREPVVARLNVAGFGPEASKGTWEILAGAPGETNTAGEPERLTPQTRELPSEIATGKATCTLAPRSFSVLRLER